MVPYIHFYAAAMVASTSLVSAHISLWHNSMWGFNVTDASGLRPQDPLMNLPFAQWWFRGYFKYPPHPNDIMQLPVGQKAMTELSCDKDATSWWPSGPGGNQQDPNNPDYPCPGQPTTQFHTNGINDLGGCALAVAYKSDVNDVQPEDFVVFSVNHTCVWNLHTYFEVPADMPPCPNNKCTCAWFWIHREDSGSEQNYMTGFQCNFANAASTKKLGTPKVPRRCGPEQRNNFTWNYANCTYGPKQPFYWYQAERNNMLEGTYTPPLYLDLYNFHDGAQNDIFVNTTDTGSSVSGSAVRAAQPAQPPSSSSSQVTSPGTSGPAKSSRDVSPPSEETKASSPNPTDPAVQSSSYMSSHDGASHTNAATTKPEPTAGGHNHHQPDQNHHKPGQCSSGSQHKSNQRGHSRDYPRDEARAQAEERALRRAWGAHRRRSVGKHNP